MQGPAQYYRLEAPRVQAVAWARLVGVLERPAAPAELRRDDRVVFWDEDGERHGPYTVAGYRGAGLLLYREL